MEGPSRGASTTAGSWSCSPASGIYLVYDWLRDKTTGTSAAAYRHALQIVDAEKFLGLYHEYSIQQAFLHVDWFMSFWNIYYGTIHFVMPVVALVWLYRKAPVRYVRWRNTLRAHARRSRSWCSGCYPLMPPRLMPDALRVRRHRGRATSTSGPRCASHLDARRPAVGRGASAPTATSTRRCRACTSGWSTWSALAVWPLLRRTLAQGALGLYPVAIFFCIVVTANHWILDAVGGWVVLALGYLGALGVERLLARRRERSSITG